MFPYGMHAQVIVARRRGGPKGRWVTRGHPRAGGQLRTGRAQELVALLEDLALDQLTLAEIVVAALDAGVARIVHQHQGVPKERDVTNGAPQGQR